LHMLSINEIEKLTSHRGVCRANVENFLDIVGQNGTFENEIFQAYLAQSLILEFDAFCRRVMETEANRTD
jgi:hypothetical protein